MRRKETAHREKRPAEMPTDITEEMNHGSIHQSGDPVLQPRHNDLECRHRRTRGSSFRVEDSRDRQLRAGGKITYIVSVVNSGTTGYTGLTLTDNLGSYTVGTSTFVPLDYVDGSLHYYIGGTEQAAPTVTAGPPMTVTGISVPAGGNAVIVYEARVNGTAPLTAESEIVNTAELSRRRDHPDHRNRYRERIRGTEAHNQQGDLPVNRR